jgi:hypothetical protein
LFSKSAVIVASLRYLGSIHLRAEAFTGSDDEAAHLTEKLGTFLDLFRTANISVSPSGTDADVKALFDSVKVAQHKDRAEVTAMVPVGFLRKMLSEAPTAAPVETPQAPTSSPAVPPAKGKKRH